MTDLSVWSDEETRPRRRRRRKNSRGKGALAVIIALLLVVGVLGGGALLAMGGLHKLKDALSSSSAPVSTTMPISTVRCSSATIDKRLSPATEMSMTAMSQRSPSEAR